MLARTAASLIAFAATIAVAQTAPTTRTSLDATLEAIDALAGTHRDLTGTFTQEKHSPLLQQPIVTRGTFFARGDVMLWASVPPEATRLRVNPTTLSIYDPAQKRVEQYPIAGKLGAMAASPLPRLSTLRAQFKIVADDGPSLSERGGADDVQIRLDPSSDDVSQYVGRVRVLLDGARGLVRVFEITDPDGEVTTIRFDSVKADTDFPASSLELNAPAGTPISRPLEPGAK